ncbi:DUF3152 domain-containing protein [Streptomyces sp. NPDC006463]|uniref:DUF3152 domain-containing protein n=1 Tax=Streptomyces sp. NPDC006463 TaxID=3364746 RepID=UPI0036A82FA4
MGRHSRKDPAPAPAPAPARPAPVYEEPVAYEQPFPYEDPVPYENPSQYENPSPYRGTVPYEEPHAGRWPQPTVTHQGYVPQERPVPGGHPEQHEPGGAWGASSGAVYGDWRGIPRARTATALLDTGTQAYDTPAGGFPQVVLTEPAPMPAPAPMPVPEPAPDPVTSTGSHRRVPGPRKPADAPAEQPGPGPGRSRKVRAYTGAAAVAVTAVVAVVVAGQVLQHGETAQHGKLTAGGDSRADAPTSRSDGRPTPDAAAAAPAPAVELTFEQKMAQQLPIDEKLAGPGTFDTVPGVAKAPGKGKVVRYRVDVEQGLGLDPQLFAEAVHRTLNDDRSWGHGGAKTFERVPGGEADFVITLASPGTTGTWCAKSGLDTTIDNVSCDSASTDRVMINAFRWAQGSATYGPDQMFAYRQMLINHEVGHRLGHGHVSCRTPGALAPIMQQQTKSLDIDGIQCKPNPWVFPGS